MDKDDLMKEIIKKLDSLNDAIIKEMKKDESCEAVIPSCIIHDMENFIGERVYFLGIS